ncbi:MAG TPA: dynamin family protein [Bacteroidota bacterium]|nr:dynamin family protein [Bacteroidota bacterium]
MPLQSITEQISRLAALRRIVDNSANPGLCARIDEEMQKLASNRFHCAVLGQFKRGKSTFLNALLGNELLPVGVTPVTSVVSLVRFGNVRSAEAVFSDGRRLDLEAGQLKEYVSEQCNPNNVKQVRYVDIAFPSEFLRDGVVLIDTPGIGSISLHNTQTTQDFIPRIDAAIVVLSADLPITGTEYKFLEDIGKHVDKVMFVLNKMDVLAPEELSEALSYARRVLTPVRSNGDLLITPLSARDALLGQVSDDPVLLQKSNLQTFLLTFERFIRQDKQTVLLQRSANRADALIAEGMFATELELKALTAPLDDLRARTDEFTRQIRLLKEERETAGYLLTGQIPALCRWIEDQLNEFATGETTRLRGAIDKWAGAHTHLPARDFLMEMQAAFASELQSGFDGWRGKNDGIFSGRYETLIGTHVGKTNEFIRRTRQIAGNLFDVQLRPIDDVQPMMWRGTFTYRTQDDPLFLEIDTLKVTAALLPASVMHKRILKRCRARIADQVTRHCGRLRYEYAYSIQESWRRFQYDLDRKVDEVIEEIRKILKTAVDVRTSSEQRITPRLHALKERQGQMLELAKGGNDEE